MARPSDYSKEIADLICERIADGETLKAICEDEALPNKATVFRWLAAHREFSDLYARAREAQGDALIEEAREIVDNGTNDWMEKRGRSDELIGWQINGEAVQRSRLRAEQRRWEASKLKPHVYGDKQTIDMNLKVDVLPYDALLERFHDLLRTGHLQLPEGVEIIEPEERDDSDLA